MPLFHHARYLCQIITPIFVLGCLFAVSALWLRTSLLDTAEPAKEDHLSSAPILGHGESTLPDLLQLWSDPADPRRVHLRVLPSIEGRARLVVDSDDPVQWLTARPQGVMSLKRHGAPEEFILEVGSAKQMKAPRLRAELVFEDERGQAFMHVSRELDPQGSEPMEALSSRLTEGQSAAGRAVRARTPLDAPEPRMQGGGL